MLKQMSVVVEYKVYVQKYVIAEDNEDGGERGYDTQRQRIEDEVCKLLDDEIMELKDVLPDDYYFEWECDSSIEEV